MLRYKTETRPGLVALYDIRSGNGAGLYSYKWGPAAARTGLVHPHTNTHTHTMTNSS